MAGPGPGSRAQTPGPVSRWRARPATTSGRAAAAAAEVEAARRQRRASFPGLMAALGAERPARAVPVVHGKVPPGLRGGYFLRNGPDFRHEPLFPDDTHWFDGDGLVHFVGLGGEAEAEYGCNYVETQVSTCGRRAAGGAEG